jgi:hypothetical protein
MIITFLALILAYVTQSWAASTTITMSPTHTKTNTAASVSDYTMPITIDSTQTTTVAFWANREGTTIAQYNYYAASVVDANSQSAVYNISCRTAVSKCTDEPGYVTQGPSIFAFSGASKAFSCTQTSERANFNCMRSTSNDPHSTAYTIAADQLTQGPMLVTAGAEKLSGLPIMSTVFQAATTTPAGSTSGSSAGQRLKVDGLALATIIVTGMNVVAL